MMLISIGGFNNQTLPHTGVVAGVYIINAAPYVSTVLHGFVTGGDQFTVSGVPIAEDLFALNAGLVTNVTENATFGLFYTGQVGSGISEHGVKASLNIRFRDGFVSSIH